MTDRDRATLLDLHRAARLVLDFVADLADESAFLNDPKTQSAVLYQIAVIGEAVGRLSDAFKENHPGIPWRDIRGMRNFVVHVYDDVDMLRVWDVAQTNIPDLIEEIGPLLPRP